MHRDEVGAMIVRDVASPRTAVWISRHDIALRWRLLDLWMIAVGVAAAVTVVVVLVYRLLWLVLGWFGAPEQYPAWNSIWSVLATFVVILVLVVLLFAGFSVRDVRRGASWVRRHANPGAVLEIRYLSDALQVATADGIVDYWYDHIEWVRVRERTVALYGQFRLRVLPRELFPPGALAFLESTAGVKVR